MMLIKTEKGRAALLNRDRSLSPRERQLLILCDGHRSHADLVQLMGATILDSVPHLMAAGLVVPKSTAPARRHATVHARAQSATAPALSLAPSGPKQRTAPARSLAATKMYMLDMLQLLRDPQAAGLSGSLRSSESEEEFMTHVLA